jgi:ABC-type Na+ transport system ATPase subunit NatA
MVGELSGMRRDARARAEGLLATFELTEAAGRPLKGYSGGMRRRLDLAANMMTRHPRYPALGRALVLILRTTPRAALMECPG